MASSPQGSRPFQTAYHSSGGMSPGGISPGGISPGGMSPGGMNPGGISPPAPSRAQGGSFQLPALDIPAASLTAGTSIPAPPPSPPPAAQKKQQQQQQPQQQQFAHRPAAPRKSPSRSLLDASPQTPLVTDQPNPLRSHPTGSSHSLGRQFSHDADAPPPPANQRREPGLPGLARETAAMPPPQSASSAAHTSSPGGAPKRTSTRGSSADYSPPPAKRPLSVRKFLGLRSLSGAFRRTSTDSGDGVYANGAHNRSSDKLSLFSMQRHNTNTSAAGGQQQPTLGKRRSSLMLLARRSSNFLGLTAEEEPRDEKEGAGGDELRAPSRAGRPRESTDLPMADVPPKKRTPPPTLPGLDGLKASRGLHDSDGGYLGGGDMFRNIR